MSIRTFASRTPARLRSAFSASFLIVCGIAGSFVAKRELHDDVAIARLDSLDQAERNDVAAEAGIFHRLERFFDLILGDRHGTGKLPSALSGVKIDARKRATPGMRFALFF